MKKRPKFGINLCQTLKMDLKMKLSLLVLLTTTFALQANSSYSQTTKVSLDVKDVTVAEVIDQIESQTEFKFIFNTRAVDLERKVSLKFKKKRINAILKHLFSDVGTDYAIDNRKILLRRGQDLNTPEDAEETDIIIKEQSELNGTVTDDTGAPLPGASIVEKETTNGTQSDFDGNFSITVADSDAILVISYIGYATQEVSVVGQTQFTIALAPDASALEEVVVVGYGTQKKTDLTGAIVSVREEDFTQGANYDAVQLLNGAASGVNVSQVSSAPGAGLKIQIRGAGSINSDNSVLFVVDGLPGVDPSSLSPGDIASMDVLKDASAAAIYGTRAANGVVLITTKKGKAGKTSLSYSVYTGFQSASKDLDVLGAQDYADLVNFRTPGTYTLEQISSFGQGTNWQDEIYRDALVQNHQISMSGGNDKGNYYLGLNYFDQDGIVENSSSQKYNIRLNMQSRPFDNLLISANANYTRQTNNDILSSNFANENAGPINSAISNDPTLSTGFDGDGRYFINPAISLDNPLALINGIENQTVINRFYASLNADYEFIENVTATLRLGADTNNSKNDFYNSRITQNGFAAGGIGSVTAIDNTHWLVEALLKYSNTFNDNHNFSIFGGITLEEFLSTGVGASSAGFLSDVTGTNLLQSGDGGLSDNVQSSRIKNQLNGFIGRATYDYKSKYLLTASFRVDGSSRFAEDNKYAFFPSGSVGWRISEEPFLSDSKTINELKLRVGYGELGNQGINNFETRQTLISGGNSVFGGAIAQGVIPARLPNPELRWETTKEINVGIDYALANNRISGSIDFFNRNTTDQLFQKPLPSVVGFTSVRTNIGEVQNRGVDFSLSTLNVDKESFKWSSNLTMSFLKNEVTQLPEFTQELVGGNIGTFINGFTIVREGDPLQSFYGYQINGIFQTGDDIAGSATPFSVADGYAAGMPRFVDQNGDGTINAEDRVVLGDPFPDFSFGFNNTFNYKNLSLEIFLQGVQGIETLDANVTESLYPTNSARNSISRYYNDRWTPSNASNTLPSGENSSLYGGAFQINSLTIADASFVRLKNVTLGYNFPLKDTSKVSFFRIYGAIDNLFTITDFEGYDPDASSGSVGSALATPGVINTGTSNTGIATSNATGVTRTNYNSYPLARTIRIGIDVKF